MIRCFFLDAHKRLVLKTEKAIRNSRKWLRKLPYSLYEDRRADATSEGLQSETNIEKQIVKITS